MTARLHRQLAHLAYRLTLARAARRHYFAGCGWPANDDGMW